MEHHGVWLSGALASDAYHSSVTGGCLWLPAKRSFDRTLRTYVDQSTTLRRMSHIYNRTDIHSIAEPSVDTCDRMYSVGDPILVRNVCQSAPGTSSSPVEECHLSTSTDSVPVDVDSTGLTVATEASTDDPGELPVTRSERHPSHSQSDVIAVDCDDEVQALGDSTVCSVCGDIAAGFHCGAYVCEACKVKI